MPSKIQKIQVLRKTGIYPVVSPGFTLGRKLTDVLKTLADAGTDVVQLRMKTETSCEILKMADKFKKICSQYGILLIINDRPDIALACSADGVHIGQNDFPVDRIAKFAKQLIVGVSTHSVGEALTAERNGADYVNIGPIFRTNTKTTGIDALGLEIVKKISRKIRIPFTVMGGIKQKDIQELVNVGAKKIAMITEICEAKNIKTKFIELQALCGRNY